MAAPKARSVHSSRAAKAARVLPPVTPEEASQRAVNASAPYAGHTILAIDFTGLKRIGKDAVQGKLVSKIGEKVSAENLKSDIQAIFGMGYFDDVEISADHDGADGVKLSYAIRERPVISKVDFDGNEQLSASDLKEVVKVKEWTILDVNKVREDVGLIQKHYEEKGFYLAKVTFEVIPTGTDEVRLVYKVNDYDKVKIKKITFLNNKRFTDDQLKAVFAETREGGALSFLSGSGSFKESAFKVDLQRLTIWYLDHGYVKFRYDNPVVTVSDDKKWLFVTVYVDEGEQYTMGQFDFSGDLLFPKDELHDELQLHEGDTFAITKRNFDIQRLTEKYQDLGYAFVNVIPKMNIKDESKTVDIDYSFEKGNLCYFGEINILGNSKTYDKVIRRELKIVEGELYSGTKMRQSRENVERLGYFAPGEVVFNTVSPKGKPDVLNVEITIKERSTGTITLGAGYGSAQGFFFQTQISEINLFGRGQTLSLSAQIAGDSKTRSINFGFTDPYAFDTRWSAGFDAYYVTFSIPDKYDTKKLGGDLRVGYPIGEYTSFFLTYKNEGLQPLNTDPFANLNQADVDADTGVLSSFIANVVRDKRNNRFETTDGNYQSISLEGAGVGGDKKFLKWTANSRYYKRIVGDLVFRNSFEGGAMYRLGGLELPPSERFYLGGPNNLKGFRLFSVGPTRNRCRLDDPTYNANTPGVCTAPILEPLGGQVEAVGLFEFEYPLIKEAGLKFVTFADIGNTFGPNDAFYLRKDVGLGFRWFSPIGPLRFEWGFPLDRRPGEDQYNFNFFIGPPF